MYQTAVFLEPQDGDVLQIFKATPRAKPCEGNLITDVIVSYETGKSGRSVVLTSRSEEPDIIGAMFASSPKPFSGNNVVMQAEYIFNEQEHNKGEEDL